MHSTEALEDIIDLEVFLFGGVPELAVQVYGKSSFGHAQSRVRHRAVSQPGYQRPVSADGAEQPETPITIVVDEATGHFEIFSDGG